MRALFVFFSQIWMAQFRGQAHSTSVLTGE